jgi:hypothetical protein
MIIKPIAYPGMQAALKMASVVAHALLLGGRASFGGPIWPDGLRKL